jgi:hypothetical protein
MPPVPARGTAHTVPSRFAPPWRVVPYQLALASRLQHRAATQFSGLPRPRAGGDPVRFARFGYASASELGWSVANANPNLETGITFRGTSVSAARLLGVVTFENRIDLSSLSAVKSSF